MKSKNLVSRLFPVALSLSLAFAPAVIAQPKKLEAPSRVTKLTHSNLQSYHFQKHELNKEICLYDNHTKKLITKVTADKPMAYSANFNIRDVDGLGVTFYGFVGKGSTRRQKTYKKFTKNDSLTFTFLVDSLAKSSPLILLVLDKNNDSKRFKIPLNQLFKDTSRLKPIYAQPPIFLGANLKCKRRYDDPI